MKATAKDLRFHAKELLESARRGEEIIITYRGKPYAKLIPFDDANIKPSDRKNNLFGIWKNYSAVSEVEKYVRNMRSERF